MNFNLFLKNGLYLPFISFFIYFITDDIYLPIFFLLKSFSINFYTNFCYSYPNPDIYRWKHLFRLTDTGHIAAFMFYFNKKTVPLAHNIHFIIDVGYYVAKIFFNMSDTDHYVRKNNDLYLIPQKIHEYTNHSLSYILIIYYMINDKNRDYIFDNYSLIYTYLWLYTWLFFIYLPWVLVTNDYIYSVLEPSKPLFIRLGIILFMNILAYISNNLGKLIYSI